MLFSLAALVEQHPSKLVLHSLAGALNFINQHDGTDGTDIMLAWPKSVSSIKFVEKTEFILLLLLHLQSLQPIIH